MRAVVVGYGSIGERHARLLQEMGVETAVVSKRNISFQVMYFDLTAAIEHFKPDFIIISNKTSEHFESLSEMVKMQWKGIVLVEKPLFDEFKEIPLYEELSVYVAYNLRLHPLFVRLRNELLEEKILSATVYAGQYLPQWRPQRDYRLSYSSRKEDGGGVLRDLSHELDYINWIFGSWIRLTALGGHYSALKMTADDSCSVIMETNNCPMLTLHMNYLDRPGRREVIVITDQHTFKIDLVKQTFEKDGVLETYYTMRDDTYRLQLHSIVYGDGDSNHLCTFNDGLEVMRIIEAIEKSIQDRKWIWNEAFMHNLC